MKTKTHICPVWVGYIMASPLRKWQQDPYKILSLYISEGMKILEIGPAMGFFSLPMAKMTGNSGTLYCVDIQEKMLSRLHQRAVKAGVDKVIEMRIAGADSLNISDLKDTINFTLLANVVHEVPEKKKLFSEITGSMKQKSTLLFIEPKGHVNQIMWEKSISTAQDCGLQVVREPIISGSRAVEFYKP
jgi:ubiquinone/menaquinone biosynthesis C-methylase UbiE